MDWSWQDGWILMAIYMANSLNGSSLADVISAADTSNHAIPTPQELTSAFSKLLSVGVIEVADDSYSITTSFSAEITAAYNKPGGLFKTVDKGQKWLQQSNFKKTADIDVTISEEQMELAYKSYKSKSKS
jgi:hypothetical protein